jgi:hypothetical protein
VVIEFADECINSWLCTLSFLDRPENQILWPTLEGESQIRVRMLHETVTFNDVLANSLADVSPLDQHMMHSAFDEAVVRSRKVS